MYLLDTNVISELRRINLGRGDRNVERWVGQFSDQDFFLSAITVEEIDIGILLAERRDPIQGLILRTWLESSVLPAFEGRIIDIDTAVARRSAFLHVPDPRPIRDGFIAATAFVHGMTVVTRNTSHFASVGVSVVNPWLP